MNGPLDWSDDRRAPTAPRLSAPNREMVEVVICPTCKSRRVERHSRRVKRMASHPLHVAAAFHSFFSAEGRRTHVNIDVPGGPELHNVRFAIISKSTPYTYLGRLPLNIARNASIDARIAH